MKRLLLTLAICAFLAAPAFAAFTGGQFKWKDPLGNTVTLTTNTKVWLTWDIPGSTNGGPFWVHLRQGNLTPQLPPTISAPPDQKYLFKTFCVEKDVTFSPGTVYWATVDWLTYSGGSASQGGGAAGDRLSDVTEWIYDQWRGSNPLGWTYAQVRDGIYQAEQEIKLVPAPKAYKDAITALYGGVDPGAANLNPALHTMALNLWNGWTWNATEQCWYANDRQSHLIPPIPAPGAILLGGIGVGLVGWLRRRRTL